MVVPLKLLFTQSLNFQLDERLIPRKQIAAVRLPMTKLKLDGAATLNQQYISKPARTISNKNLR